MGKHEKFLLKILSGSSDRNIDFEDLCNFLKRLGFAEYTRGSHHMFRREGSKAKPYQIKQVRNIIQRYGLGDLSDV
jgi:hypothetical protein